ncbi:MAG: IS110 family transposase [Thermotogota bacterium]|nr:IS110 family transposase [Thermotogota bacterium]
MGVDIAKDKHYAQVVNWRKQTVRKGLGFQNKKGGFEKFLRWVQKALKQTGANDVLVAMEPTGSYYFVFEEYLERLGIEVAIVNGREVRRNSEIMGNDSSKNDPRDALIISQLTIDGRYGPSTRPKTGIYAELKELIGVREMLAAFKHFGTLEKLIAAGPEGIQQVWQDLQINNYGHQKAQALYNLARTSIGIKRDSEAAAYKLRTLINKYESNQEELHATEEKIRQLLEQLPEAQLLMTIKGIGPVIAGTFLSEIGDIRHYNSPKQIQKLAGYAITSKASGKMHGKEKSSKMGRKLIETILYKAAIVLIGTNDAFREIYDYYTKERKRPANDLA